jgi:hypothetical protein
VVATGILLPAATAGGDAPNDVGWWTSENPGQTAGPVPTLVPTGSPTGAPSDIPPGGLEVQEVGPAVSYAALSYDTNGATVQSLGFKLASGGHDLPNSKVQACPLTGSGQFSGTYGGPLGSGPAYDCSSAVVGVQDSSGTVSFDTSRLVRGDRMAVAIVAAGDGTRLVFAPPDQSTVVVAPTAAAPAGGSAGAAVATEVAPPAPGSSAPLASLPPPAGGMAPVAPQAAASPPAAAVGAAAPTSDMTPVTEQSDVVPVGSAVFGCLLVVAGALATVVRNRKVAGS